MANQSPQRRDVLRILSLAAAASQFPGFSRWVCASEHTAHASSGQTKPANYTPQFFSPNEYVTIELLSDLIIPSDGTPGAKEAGVSEFIDFMAASDPEIQQPFRTGLRWLNEHAQENHGSGFANLAAEQQIRILEVLARAQAHGSSETEGQKFFSLVRRYTVMGYYTSRVGMEQLDCPELKFYSKSPECPHKDDPEHLHLPPPKF